MRQARLEELHRQLAEVLARNVPEQNDQNVQTQEVRKKSLRNKVVIHTWEI